MRRFRTATIRAWERWRAAALTSALFLLVGATAQGFPLYFTGPGGFGVSQADALASGLPIISEAPLTLNPGELGIVTPDPITLDTQARANGPSDPATGTTEWQVTNLGLQDDEDLWLVFWSKASSDPYYPHIGADQVGLEVSAPDWAIFRTHAGEQAYYYPAVFLGDLPIGETTGATIHYRELRNLVRVRGDYMFPKYWVGRVNAPIPEPSSALLFAAGLAGLAATWRTRC